MPEECHRGDNYHAIALSISLFAPTVHTTLHRCAAVLHIDGKTMFCDGPPAQSIMEGFRNRADNQITSLEILAIAVGLSTFRKELCGRNVLVYSDNTGAEAIISQFSAVLRMCCSLLACRVTGCRKKRSRKSMGSVQNGTRDLDDGRKHESASCIAQAIG